MNLKSIILVLLGVSFMTPAIATNGNQPIATGQGARGVGGEGLAYPQDSLAAGINPAAGVWLENRVDAGLEVFRPDREFSVTNSDLNLPNGTFDGIDTSTFIIPEFGYNKKFANNRAAFTLAIYGAGGQNTDYNNHDIFRAASRKPPGTSHPAGVNLEQLFIQPTISAKYGDNHSFGLSLITAFQSFEAEGIGALSGQSYKQEAFSDRGRDYAHGIGISFGWIGKLTDRLTLGTSYQSKIKMSDFDDYAGLFPGGNLDVPEKYGIGLALKLNNKLDFLFDVYRVKYSDTKALGNSTTG